MPIVRRKKKRARNAQTEFRLGCPFCWEWLPPPTLHLNVFSGDGCEGGQCQCGVFFVIDRTGKFGGQALLDARALACNGDLEQALALREGTDYQLKTRKLTPETATRRPVATGHSYLEPQVWVIKRKLP